MAIPFIRSVLPAPKPKILKPGYHLSGIINVPTGTGVDQTKISLKKGERIWLKSISKTLAVVWDDNRKREIKIPHRGTRRPCTKTGKLQFVKQAYPTRIDYEISPG